MSKRRETRREKREEEKKSVRYSLTIENMAGIAQTEAQKARVQGIKEGCRMAVEACMSAYSIVLSERHNMPEAEVLKVFQEANDEVFKLLDARQLDLADLPEFARRCGVA